LQFPWPNKHTQNKVEKKGNERRKPNLCSLNLKFQAETGSHIESVQQQQQGEKQAVKVQINQTSYSSLTAS